MHRTAVLAIVVTGLVTAATVPVAADHLGPDDPDAECFVTVPIGGQGTCTDTWSQPTGTLDGSTADWHSTFHDPWTFGQITLTIFDDTGRDVFQRNCQWTGPTAVTGTGGFCEVRSEDGTPGTWTMRLDAKVDVTLGASSTAHAAFNMTP